MQGLIFLTLLALICAQPISNRMNTTFEEDYPAQPDEIVNDNNHSVKDEDISEEDTKEMGMILKEMPNLSNLRTLQIIFNFNVQPIKKELDSSMEAVEEEDNQPSEDMDNAPSFEGTRIQQLVNQIRQRLGASSERTPID